LTAAAAADADDDDDDDATYPADYSQPRSPNLKAVQAAGSITGTYCCSEPGIQMYIKYSFK
jgi:hypothetical protein